MKSKESPKENIPIAVIGINHRTANVDIREKAVFSDKQQETIMHRLSKLYRTRGIFVLSTCNRIEIYVCGRKAIKYMGDICAWLDNFKKERIFCDQDLVYIFKGRDAIHHFFRVISSLDSQIIGEPQITGQVKDAYEKSHLLKHTDIFINKMYNFGMQVEKLVRSKTYLADGAVSISFAAVELARKIFGNLQNTTVLLIGAGETAELAALHFVKRDVSNIIVVNRTFKKARHLAAEFQGEAIQLKNLLLAIEQADIVITATSSDHFIVGKQDLEKVAKQRDYKPIFLIDLAIPRDVNPDVTDIDGVFLYNLDALQEIVQNNIEQRKAEIPKAEKIVEDHVFKYLKWYNTLPMVKTITQLSKYFEEIREREFERLKSRFPENSLGDAEYLSKSLMKKLLHHHIMTLRRSNGDPLRLKQHIDLVGEIYQLNDPQQENDKKN
ncbi:glutamyl-tRNA reductase [Candidatus Pacearchaeota archaeon]|nr:glutamyl-tRNA reductase [Candidatus Pacearchaeota archaeon]